MSEQFGLRKLLAADPESVGSDGVFNVVSWTERRRGILSAFSKLLGAPSSMTAFSGKFETLECVELPSYTRKKIQYQTEVGTCTYAYLNVPHERFRAHRLSGQLPAVLCQHGTNVAGKEDQMVARTRGMRNFAHQLAVNGFITLAPDYFVAGESISDDADPYDTDHFYEKHPRWSAVGKAIYDGKCAIDILSAHPDVDRDRIGAVGHSMGGHYSIFLAALDERVKAIASTCGMSVWEGNRVQGSWGWKSKGVGQRTGGHLYFPQLARVFEECEIAGRPLPYDLHEFAALIAPRAFLNISAANDKSPGLAPGASLAEAGVELNRVWALLGQAPKFVNVLVGGDHDIPSYCIPLVIAWFEYWLGIEDLIVASEPAFAASSEFK